MVVSLMYPDEPWQVGVRSTAGSLRTNTCHRVHVIGKQLSETKLTMRNTIITCLTIIVYSHHLQKKTEITWPRDYTVYIGV